MRDFFCYRTSLNSIIISSFSLSLHTFVTACQDIQAGTFFEYKKKFTATFELLQTLLIYVKLFK